MIFKILLFIVVLFLIYLIFFKKNKEKDVSNTKKQNQLKEELMLECSSCKVYFSKDEGILSNGKYFCSKECVR